MSDDNKRFWIERVPFLSVESFFNCIKTITFEFKWNPYIFDKMYFDDFDNKGLLFWYNAILKEISEQKNKD